MTHKHHGHDCKHETLKFCKKCHVPYCEDCGHEWAEKCTAYHYYPWTSGTNVWWPHYDSTTTVMLDTTLPPDVVTCLHT